MGRTLQAVVALTLFGDLHPTIMIEEALWDSAQDVYRSLAYLFKTTAKP